MIFPNFLTLYRLMSLPFFLYYLSLGEKTISLLLFFSAVFSDFLDGYLARRWNLVSRLGSILDPIVDKVFVVTTVFYFFMTNAVPLWFLVLILFRDLSQALGFIFLWMKKLQYKVEAQWSGKLSTGAHFLLILILILKSPIQSTVLLNVLLILASTLTIISFFHYGIIWGHLYNKT